MKRESFIEKITNFFTKRDIAIIIIFSMVIGGIIGGIIFYNSSKPTDFTKEEINTYTLLANEIWAHGSKSIDKEMNEVIDKVNIQILSNSEIRISSLDLNKGYIDFYFSKYSLEKVTPYDKIITFYIFIYIFLGIIVGASTGFFILLSASLVLDLFEKIKESKRWKKIAKGRCK